MCRREDARSARRTLGDAISRFDLAIDTVKAPRLPTRPPARTGGPTKTLAALAEIYRGAAATVTLPQLKQPAGRRK